MSATDDPMARTVIGYHGCDADVAARLLAGEPLELSKNAYDWLGWGAYFWEHGPDRALRFAEEQKRRGKVRTPAVVGAVLQFGNCFDLLDTRFTEDLATAYLRFTKHFLAFQIPLPSNAGGPPDHKLRYLDCAVLNWYLDAAARSGTVYDTVRGAFVEGGPVYQGSAFHRETHIQIAVRTPASATGLFSP